MQQRAHDKIRLIAQRVHSPNKFNLLVEDGALLAMQLDKTQSVAQFKQTYCEFLDKLLEQSMCVNPRHLKLMLRSLTTLLKADPILRQYPEITQHFYEAAALNYIQRKDIRRAFKYLKKVELQDHPHSAEISIALGSMASLLGDRDAESYHTRAVKSNINSLRAGNDEQQGANLGMAMRNAAINLRGKLKQKYLQKSDMLLGRVIWLPPSKTAKGRPLIFSKQKLETVMLKYTRKQKELIYEEHRAMRVLPQRALKKGQLRVFQGLGSLYPLEFQTDAKLYLVTVRLEGMSAGEFLTELATITQIGNGNLNGRIQGCTFRRLPFEVVIHKYR